MSQQGLPSPNFGLLSVLRKLASFWTIQKLFLVADLFISNFQLQDDKYIADDFYQNATELLLQALNFTV